MITGTSTSESRTREYETLRAELLSLQEAASKAWRGGLIGLGALSGVLAASVFGLKGQLLETLRSEFSGAVVDIVFLFFYMVGLGIAVLEARTAAKAENAADRIGGFLAVFHDLELEGKYIPPLGWHIWNRIEKASLKDVPNGLTKKTLRVLKVPLSLLPFLRERGTEKLPIPRVTYVQDHFFVYVPVLLAYQAFLFFLAYILSTEFVVIGVYVSRTYAAILSRSKAGNGVWGFLRMRWRLN
jgi:hypothetical protein